MLAKMICNIEKGVNVNTCSRTLVMVCEQEHQQNAALLLVPPTREMTSSRMRSDISRVSYISQSSSP